MAPTTKELSQRIDYMDRALIIQAAEYERRLETLNHAHEQNTARNAEFISREIFDQAQKANTLRLEEMTAKFEARFSQFNKTLIATTGLLLTVIAIAVTVLLAFHG